jgi:CPA1 family monovalent cation:H+ antiporter
LLTVIVVRAAWHMPFNAVVRWRHRRFGFNPPRPMLRPSRGSGLLISWAGMRGIVTLAAAMALPAGFPFRQLIVLTAFSVVLGTLVIQGLTLKPLLRGLGLQDDDPVGRETRAARDGALGAALAALASHPSPAAKAVRLQFTVGLASNEGVSPRAGVAAVQLHRLALRAAREALVDMRATDAIGDDAFHAVEEQLDRLEVTIDGPA